MTKNAIIDDESDETDHPDVDEETAVAFLEDTDAVIADLVPDDTAGPVVGVVPSIDQEVPVASYDDWVPEDTTIITCRIGEAPYKGRPFASYAEAKAAIKHEHGRILEYNTVPGRAFMRVWRVQAR